MAWDQANDGPFYGVEAPTVAAQQCGLDEVAVMVADLVKIADASRRADGTDIPLGKQLREAAALISALSADNERQAAGAEIADAVLAWMVKFDLLDADNEYRASDVLAVLDDLAPSARSTAKEAGNV